MEIINNAPHAPKPIGPYSQAVVANGFIFTAGQIALDPESGKLIEGGIAEQTVQVLQNLASVLAFSNSGFDRVVMTTVFLTDISHGKVVNELYGKVVSEIAPPARQTVAVKELPMGALIEISVIARTK